MGEITITITGEGMHYLNKSQRRRVLIEKEGYVNILYEKIIEILNRIQYGRTVFASYFPEDTLATMFHNRLVKQGLFTTPRIYQITPA